MGRSDSIGEKRVRGFGFWLLAGGSAILLALLISGIISRRLRTAVIDILFLDVEVTVAILAVSGVLLAAVIIPFARHAIARRRRLSRLCRGVCARCAYEIESRDSIGICPECGLAFDRRDRQIEIERLTAGASPFRSRELPAAFARALRHRSHSR